MRLALAAKVEPGDHAAALPQLALPALMAGARGGDCRLVVGRLDPLRGLDPARAVEAI